MSATKDNLEDHFRRNPSEDPTAPVDGSDAAWADWALNRVRGLLAPPSGADTLEGKRADVSGLDASTIQDLTKFREEVLWKPFGEPSTIPSAGTVTGVKVKQCQGIPEAEWDKALEITSERYKGLWNVIVYRVLAGDNSTLKERIKQIRGFDDTAGLQYTDAMLQQWRRIEEDDIQRQVTRARTELDRLQVTGNDALNDFDYPKFRSAAAGYRTITEHLLDAGAGNLQDLFQRLENGSLPPDQFQRELQTTTEAITQAYIQYLAQEAVLSFLVGPVYIEASEVTGEQLQYTYGLSPMRDPIKPEIMKLYPLSWPPWPPDAGPAPGGGPGGGGGAGGGASTKIKEKHRGFLVAHANWGKEIGGASGTEEYRPPYESRSDATVEKLRETPGLAMGTARILNPSTGGSGSLTCDPENDLDATGGSGSSSGGGTTGGSDPGDDPAFHDPDAVDFEFHDNPMVEGISESTAGDGDAMKLWVDEWNERVDYFLETVKATHDRHASNLDIKAWPEDPPGTELDALTKGLLGPSLDGSRGAVYIGQILDPEVNRQRAAFRFESMERFEQFVAGNDGQVYGTYFIDEQDAVLDPDKLFPNATDKVFQGRAYLAFPGKVTIKGNDLRADPGPLVIVGQSGGGSGGGTGGTGGGGGGGGVELEGSAVEAYLLSNGSFKAPPGSTVSGTLVTTGTPMKPPIEPDPNMTGVTVEDFVSQSRGTLYGRLDDFTIRRPANPAFAKRTDLLKLIMSPYRVAQDFEVHREAR